MFEVIAALVGVIAPMFYSIDALFFFKALSFGEGLGGVGVIAALVDAIAQMFEVIAALVGVIAALVGSKVPLFDSIVALFEVIDTLFRGKVLMLEVI